MGIVTDPGYILYGNDCTLRYPAGLTPKQLYVSFAGINIHQPVIGTMPTNPNQIFLIKQNPSSPCNWYARVGNWDIDLIVNATKSRLVLTEPSLTIAFYDTGSLTAQSFTNTFFAPWPYYGGSAWITSRPNTGNQTSITSVAGLLNIETADKTFAEIFPAGPDHAIYKFNRKTDKTNILIKIAT